MFYNLIVSNILSNTEFKLNSPKLHRFEISFSQMMQKRINQIEKTNETMFHWFVVHILNNMY